MKDNMPKPIVLMHIPDNFNLGKGIISPPVELMNMFNGWDKNGSPAPEFLDYLWLVFNDPNIDSPTLQVFHPKDFNETQYEKLKQLVLSELEKLKI